MKKLKLYLFVAFISITGMYSYLWFLAANKLEMAIVDQVKILESKDYRIAYGAIRVKGFPFGINLEIDDPLIEAPTPVSASLSIQGVLHGYASIFDPTTVSFSANQGVTIKTTLVDEEANSVLKAEGLTATMPFPDSLEDFSVTFKNVHIAALDVKLETLECNLNLYENSKTKNSYTIIGTKIDPGKKFVGTFPQIIDEFQIQSFFTGKVKVDVPLEKAIESWYSTEGMFNIKTLSLKWGDLKVKLNGTFSLDESLQPLAAFSAEIYGLDPILEKLVEFGFVHKNLLPILKTSLLFLRESKEDEAGKKKSIYHKVAVTIQDNDLIIGSIPVLKFPPINWSKLGE